MDVRLLWIACALFAAGIGLTIAAIRQRRTVPPRLNFFLNLTAFGLISLFLFQRGEVLGRCPLTTPFEVFLFLSWSLLLIYLVVGSAYRLTLLGGFTSPLAGVLVLIALFTGDVAPHRAMGPTNAWVELHAALSVIAYGAFGLACVAGIMFLVQCRQLKSRHPHRVAFDLPALRDLALANRRLATFGFALLTAGLLAGFFAGALPRSAKLGWALFVWILYGGLLLFRLMRPHASASIAGYSVGAFAISLVGLGGIAFLLH
jgi:HemX protein